MKYNAVLRGLPKLVEWLEKKMVELCDDNRYVTTLHCINSAIVKLGRLSKPRTVYRGLSGSVLPPQFWKGTGNGGVEFAFMSTTADRAVAMRYANNDVSKDSSKGERANAKTVIEIEMGMIDRGADLQWLSQYPNEREITFAPFTGLEIVSTRIEESVLVVQMRLNVNLMSPTIETSVAKMRSAHVQLLDLIHSNLRAANAPKRVLLSLQGLKGAEKGKDADWFNKVVNFRNATEMALETQHEAFYALNDPALWEREEETLKKDAERRVKMLKELKNPEQVAALEQEEQALKDKVGKVVIPEKMRLSAAICARAGEHYVALQLLRQAARKDNQAITFATVSQDFHGTRSIRRRSSTFTMDDSVHEEVNKNHRWKLELASHLMSLDVPSPWPATLCRLTTPQGTMGPQSAVDEEAGEDEGKVRDAVVDVIKRTLLEHTVHNDEDLQMEKTLGMRGLAKGVDLLVLRSSEVGGLTFKGWRKAKVGGMEEKPLFGPSDVTSRAKLEEYRIKKEGLATRLIVQASGGQGPPTIALATSHSTYEVEWAPLDDSAGSDAVSAADNWPDPGTYVITHLEAGDVIIQQMSGVVELSTSMSMASGLVAGAERADAAAAATDAPRGITKARLRNPQEHFLSAKMREGGNVQQYSSRQVAKGEVLLMPRVNPRVPSGAGALLREAAATGNDKLLKALLEAGVSVFEADHTATTAVHVAAEHGHVGAFKLLFNAMKQGGERQDALDQRNLNGKRVTDIYLESGHVPLARVVKPSESDQHIARLQKEEPEALEWMDRFSDSPEHQTEGQAPGLSRKRPSRVSLGGAQRALTEPEEQELAALATKTAVGGVTALMLACRLPTLFDAMFAVSALLQVKADPTAVTESGCTALSMAAEMGYVEVGKTLLQAGAKVDAPLRDGKTPLMLSCKNGHCKMTELLLKHGAEPTEQERNGEQEGFTPIMHAALFGKVECVEVVIGHCEAHLQATFGSAAPPPSAAPHGKLQRMSSMVQKMAVTEGGPTPLHDVLNARSVRENDTALMLASRHGQRKVVQLLLRKRASVDLSNLKGETALHMASRQGHAQVVCALLTGGAKADSPDSLGYTALHHCCVTNGGEDVADALLAIGAGVNVVNRDKNTPLHFACMAGNHRMVEALLKQKVDLSLRNANSQVAYDVATLAGHDNVKQKLQPVRTHMLLQMPSIKTEDEFIEARKFVREYGLQRLKRELVAPGLIDRFTGQLTTGMKPFNVFAKAGCADWKDRDPYVNDLLTTANKALEKADPEGAKQFKVAYNLAANDANWNSSAPEHLGKASMSKHHRFMIIRKPGPDYKPGENAPTDDGHRMDYTWTWFNVVTMGMRDVDPTGNLLDPDDISKLEADPEKNIAALEGAVRCLRRMKEVALAFVQEDRKAAGTTDWSDNIKLYFHCYPHCSVNSLHLHIVDADHLGPSHGLMDFKNLEIDIVIAAFEREIKEATVLNQTDA